MKIESHRARRAAVLVAMAAAVVLSGCREEEQDRVLLFEQGEYHGTPDSHLSDDQVDELRSRAQRQQY